MVKEEKERAYLTDGQIGWNKILLLVNRRDVRLVRLLTDDLFIPSRILLSYARMESEEEGEGHAREYGQGICVEFALPQPCASLFNERTKRYPAISMYATMHKLYVTGAISPKMCSSLNLLRTISWL